MGAYAILVQFRRARVEDDLRILTVVRGSQCCSQEERVSHASSNSNSRSKMPRTGKVGVELKRQGLTGGRDLQNHDSIGEGLVGPGGCCQK
jgi:hypothetical protein